jgi:uncharacterized protein (TIGR03083 family)
MHDSYRLAGAMASTGSGEGRPSDPARSLEWAPEDAPRSIPSMTTFGMSHEQALDVLEAECARASAALEGLPEALYDGPTRCPPWNVKGLVGHLWRDIDRIVAYAGGPGSGPAARAETDAVSYWRSYDPVVEGPLISQRSSEVADRFATGADLATSFSRHWPECIAAARAMKPGDVIRTRLTWMRIDEFVGTRVVEATVHGLDLAEAVEMRPWPTPAGMAITRAILVALLGGPPPESLAGDDIAFIETGTGRRPLEARARKELGSAADLFPLLS